MFRTINKLERHANGYAEISCKGYDLLAHIDLYYLESTNGNDSGAGPISIPKEYVPRV